MTNPVTRHPAVLAGGFATLDELADGRVILGIGVGESAVRTIQQRPATLARLEAVTHVLRGLLGGEEVEFDGAKLRITWSAARQIPIFFASSGPRSLYLAGRVADGVLIQVGSDPALVAYALGQIDKGAQDAGRSPTSVIRYVRLACSVGEQREQVRADVRAYAAIAAGTVYNSVPKEHIASEVWADLKRMKDGYDYYKHGSSSAPQTELITDRIVDAVAIAGTPGEAIPRFRALLSLGVDGFVIPVVSQTPYESMREIAQNVVARLWTEG